VRVILRHQSISIEALIPSRTIRLVRHVYQIVLTPGAQRLLDGLRFEIIPFLANPSAVKQGLEVLIGASPAEDVPDFIEIIGQEFAREVESQLSAQIEPRLSGSVMYFSSLSISAGSSSSGVARSSRSDRQ